MVRLSWKILALTLLLPINAFADNFEIHDAYRSGARHSWRGNEFSLHYITHDLDLISYGAYVSNSTWRINQETRGHLQELGPEVRINGSLGPVQSYAGLQYSIFSDGSYNVGEKDVGAKVRGPRLSLGALYPIDSIGLILSFGVTKGWEQLYSYSDSHVTKYFGSHNIFIGLSI